MVEAEEKREGNGREVARLATGGRYLLAGGNSFRKISKFAVMFMGTFLLSHVANHLKNSYFAKLAWFKIA